MPVTRRSSTLCLAAALALAACSSNEANETDGDEGARAPDDMAAGTGADMAAGTGTTSEPDDTSMTESPEGAEATEEAGAASATGCSPATGIAYAYACWPMPNPSSSGLPHPASYTDLGDTVLDNVTGLVWQKTVPAETYAWDAAQTYCESLSIGGRVWHLPTRIELLSITDFTRTGPAIDVAAFPKTPVKFFWTSSPWVVSQIPTKPQYSWIVNFYEGLTSNAGDRTKAYGVRCVSSSVNAPLPPLYTPVATGEVEDTQTGLIWQQGSSPATIPAADAGAYCATLGLNGHTWRLPSIKELSTLVNETPPINKVSPAIDTAMFPGTAPNKPYWSSSLFNKQPISAHAPWAINFADGFTGYSSTAGFARCVR